MTLQCHLVTKQCHAVQYNCDTVMLHFTNPSFTRKFFYIDATDIFFYLNTTPLLPSPLILVYIRQQFKLSLPPSKNRIKYVRSVQKRIHLNNYKESLCCMVHLRSTYLTTNIIINRAMVFGPKLFLSLFRRSEFSFNLS